MDSGGLAQLVDLQDAGVQLDAWENGLLARLRECIAFENTPEIRVYYKEAYTLCCLITLIAAQRVNAGYGS